MKKHLKKNGVYLLSHLIIISSFTTPAYGESASDYISIPPLINTSSSGDKPNVLFILDNSNSMDEAPSGQAVGSANSGSKSEIARNAVENIIDTFSGSARMGLMAYKQSSVQKRKLHDSQYDASYNPSNYDPDFTGDRASSTKRYRVPNPTNSGAYVYYNIALPFYASSNYGTAFCYSSTAKFDNGSESSSGPWDSYWCYTRKTGTSDGFSGFSNYWFRSSFSPTDSDYAQNILDFGTNLTWQYVSDTWYSNSSPGKGYLHVEIDEVDTAHKASLKNKLAKSQFSSSTDTPLRNAGLTPIQGSLKSAHQYYSGTLPSGESTTGSTPSAPPTNTCSQQDYVILVTDGLPSTDEYGNKITDTNTAIQDAANEAASLLADGIKTYVIGFALPTGVDSALLDKIAIAGGTEATYLADDYTTLNDSLQSIFLSFSNRDASSSSSAVLAKNSRGEGAVFQAIYSPEQEDSSGNKVTWVGNLFGLFIDERGLLREDTNQNQQLDGYNTDRIAEYYFDSSAGKTKVKLFLGSSPSSPPNTTTQTPESVVEVSELNKIWEARDKLGELSDVLTQRDYENNSSQGRYIISSVDGTNTIDFTQISDSAIAALVAIQSAAEEDLKTAKENKNVSEAQYIGIKEIADEGAETRDQNLQDRDDAQAAVDAAQAVLDAAVTPEEIAAATLALNEANLVLIEAQAALDESESLIPDFTSQLEEAEEAYNNASLAYSLALEAYNAATAEVNNSNSLINYLDVPSVQQAYDTVKYTRGHEGISGFRSRTIDYDGDGVNEVWRLGDIVHSSPVIVSSPGNAYDGIYDDKTYAAFREKYKNRRNVLYVGANDGMLHAFNSGFWDSEAKAFKESNSFVEGTAVTHPLGAELWASWGWGTVLMVGMRFGGGEIDIDSDADGTDDTTLRSSYMLFDVTDPEQPPSLIAEISDPRMGFATSVPTVIKKRSPKVDYKETDTNNWYVAFGSGPTELADASSTQNAGLYIYDLNAKSFVSGFAPLTLEANSFVGDITSFDAEQDFIDDTLYFGVSGGSPSAGSTGLLKRTRLDVAASSSTSTLINTVEPIISAPTVSHDENGRRWVNYGTGRLFTAPDNITTQARRFYGVMEPVDTSSELSWGTVLSSDLENTTNYEVKDTGTLSDGGATVQIPSGTDITSYKKLISAIREHRDGWLRSFDATSPATRNINKSDKANNVLFYTSYTPASNSCQPEGTSRLYAVDYRTGTALPFEVFATDDDPATTEGDVAETYINLGQGLASAPIVLNNSEGSTVFTSKSTTEQLNTEVRTGVFKKGRQTWRQIFID